MVEAEELQVEVAAAMGERSFYSEMVQALSEVLVLVHRESAQVLTQVLVSVHRELAQVLTQVLLYQKIF